MTRKIPSSDLDDLSGQLEQAEKQQQSMQALTDIKSDLTMEEAYRIQLVNIQKKVNEGHQVVGKKIGLTSIAMQELLGVDEPDYGHLLDTMAVESGGEIPPNRVLQPKVEGEVAFILKEELRGPSITVEDVMEATESVMTAIEIVDSRISDWKITLPDTIADNASSGLYVLGDNAVPIQGVNLPRLNMELFKNGERVNTGKGSAALGNPAKCVAWLANKLAKYDISLKKGEVILSGALSAAVNAKPGDEFSVRIDQLGEASVRFTK